MPRKAAGRVHRARHGTPAPPPSGAAGVVGTARLRAHPLLRVPLGGAREGGKLLLLDLLEQLRHHPVLLYKLRELAFAPGDKRGGGG